MSRRTTLRISVQLATVASGARQNDTLIKAEMHKTAFNGKRWNVLVPKKEESYFPRTWGKITQPDQNITFMFNDKTAAGEGDSEKKKWTAFISGASALLILTAYQHWC